MAKNLKFVFIILVFIIFVLIVVDFYNGTVNDMDRFLSDSGTSYGNNIMFYAY